MYISFAVYISIAIQILVASHSTTTPDHYNTLLLYTIIHSSFVHVTVTTRGRPELDPELDPELGPELDPRGFVP